jgi:hypothetical protein
VHEFSGITVNNGEKDRFWIGFRGLILADRPFILLILMISVEPSAFVGEGSHRACYVHPDNSNLCIKIGSIESKGSRREIKYYERLQKKKNISWESLSQFHGIVDTNLGPGAIYDLLRDYDGEISKSLEYYLDTEDNPQDFHLQLGKAVREFKTYLLKNVILTRTIRTENVLYKKISPDEGTLVIIDNIGNSDFLPLCTYSEYFARRKVSRKWAAFERAMLRQYGQNSDLREVFTT